MDLNQGRFLANGRCGYILKPAFLCSPKSNFNPENTGGGPGHNPTQLTIRVSASRDLCLELDCFRCKNSNAIPNIGINFFKCKKPKKNVEQKNQAYLFDCYRFSSHVSLYILLLRSSLHSSFQKSTRTKPAPSWTHRCRWRFMGWPSTTPERKHNALTTMVKSVLLNASPFDFLPIL